MSIDNKIVAIKLGERIKALRQKEGITERAFAAYVNIAESQVWRIETGKGNPTLKTLTAIANYFNLTLTQLVEGL